MTLDFDKLHFVALFALALLIVVPARAADPQPPSAQPAAPPSSPTGEPTYENDGLFHALGDRPGIDKITEYAIANYLADPRIKDEFDNTNMDRFRKMLADHLCVVAGGPCVYTGHSMMDAHKGLHLHTGDFNALVEDTQDALDKAGIDFRTQNRLLARLAPIEHQVVTR